MTVVSLNYPHPPAPPATYAVPGGATSVTTAAGLTTQLATSPAKDIVLENGTYDKGASTYWDVTVAHRVYARNLGAVTLKNGASIHGAGAAGAIFRGIAWNVDNTTKAIDLSDGYGTNILHMWGGADSVSVLDCTFEGNSTAGAGIRSHQPNGAIFRRLDVNHFLNWGLFVHNYGGSDNAIRTIIDDFVGQNVGQGRIKNGTSEFCLWIGCTADVKRVKLRNGAWGNGWTGGRCTNSILEHVDSTTSQIAFYPEHNTTSTVFRFSKWSGNIRGAVCEGNGGVGGSGGGTNFCTFEDMVVINEGSTPAQGSEGIQLGGGCENNTIRRVKFINPSIACIEDLDDTITSNIYDSQGNSYTEKQGGAVDVTRTPHNW